MKSMYYKLAKYVHAPYGKFIFALLVFVDECAFGIPVTLLLAYYCLHDRSKSILYALIATAMSVSAAIFGYSIGLLLWNIGQNYIYYIISPENFDFISNNYKLYQGYALLAGALTPIPFKVFTITAGFCKLSLPTFLFFAALTRGSRFMAVAVAIYIWGNRLQYYIDKYFYYLMTLTIFTLAAFWWLLH